jgi:transposase
MIPSGGRPPHHWKTSTFLAALSADRIDAPWLLDRAINGERFRLYVESVLLPTLRPGDIVIADDLGSHKSKVLRHLIRSLGARLMFLPKYSPDLNSIEQLFVKLKYWVRKAAQRTVETVCVAIAETFEAVTPEECQNSFTHAGYGPT